MRTPFIEILASISALTAAACGNSQVDCTQSLCGCGNRGGTQTVHKPYLQCSFPDASGDAMDAATDAPMDAASDAVSDASDDAEVDSGPMCFSGCFQVCQNQSQINGTMFLETCSDQMTEAGSIEAVCIYGPPPCGRRPEGLRRARVNAGDAIANFLAGAAHLEAASVHAFDRLACELEDFGAPRELSERARKAARDERRHARAMTRLAREKGATVPRVARAARRHPRSLFEIALENGTEGCVREAYGALFAVWQSNHAADPSMREASSDIARDEAEHAELAHDVHLWARETLGPLERAALDGAVQGAWDALEREVERTAPNTRLTRELGVPSTVAAVRLVRELRAALS